MVEITSVSAKLAYFDTDETEQVTTGHTNDAAFLLLTCANGAHANIEISMAEALGEHGQEQRVQLYGSDGVLESYATFVIGKIRGAKRGQGQPQALPILT